MRRIFVVIPAYNEERSVGRIVQRVLKNPTITQCIVIDDCSTDRTANVAGRSGAEVIRNVRNVGSGASIATGLRRAAEERAELVIFMDADGQHDPTYLPILIKAMDATVDYVVASRYMLPGEHVTVFSRRVGTKLIAGLFSLLYGRTVSDPTSGFRAMNKKTIHYLLPRFPVIFSEPETALELIEQGFMIKEIPCQMKPRLYGSSSITSDKALYFMMYIVTKMAYRKMRKVLSFR